MLCTKLPLYASTFLTPLPPLPVHLVPLAKIAYSPAVVATNEALSKLKVVAVV